MAPDSNLVISVTPQTLQSQRRGSSAGTCTQRSQQRNGSSHKVCNTAGHKRQQKASQSRPKANAAVLNGKEEYYGGESLWCEDIQEEISTVSYRATRMTESVKRLFVEISANARPLQRGETRALIYLAKERYEKEMENDYCLPRKTNAANKPYTSVSAPKSSYDCPDEHVPNYVENDDVHSDTVNLECTLSQTSSVKERSTSKQAVLRNKLELFPHSRAGSRASQANIEQAVSSSADQGVSTDSLNQDTRSFTYDRFAACAESSFPLNLTFKKAFLYAKYHLSQWIKHSRE